MNAAPEAPAGPTPLALVYGQPLSGRQDLKEGDVLQVGGLTLEFHLRD